MTSLVFKLFVCGPGYWSGLVLILHASAVEFGLNPGVRPIEDFTLFARKFVLHNFFIAVEEHPIC